MPTNRTNSRPKTVGGPSRSTRVVHIFPAELLKLLDGRMPLPSGPELEGDLSSWILTMHRWSAGRPPDDVPALPKEDAAGFLSVLNEMANSRHVGAKTPGIFKRIHEAGTEFDDLLEKAYESGNREEVNRLLPEFVSQILNASGLPTAFSRMIMSPGEWLKLARAACASFRCMAFLGEHPVVLISRASKGDRRAVLDLIKMDKMFLSDESCRATIRKAGLNDDTRFLGQLQRASKYRHRAHRRDLLRLYIFALIACEQFGVPIPHLSELWAKLDPLGREYESLAAFEKDFQRRRRELENMVKEAGLVSQSP